MALPNWENLKLDTTRQISARRWNRLVDAVRGLVLRGGPGVMINYAGAEGTVSVNARRGGAGFNHPFQGTYVRNASGNVLVNIRLGRVYGRMDASASEIPLLGAGGSALSASPPPTTDIGTSPTDGDHRWFLEVKIDCVNEDIMETPVVLYKAPAAADPTTVEYDTTGSPSCTDGAYYYEIYRQRWASGVLTNEWQMIYKNVNMMICGSQDVHAVPGA